MTDILISLAVFVLPVLVLYGLEHAPPSPYDNDDRNGTYL